ncbi:MAG: hypothetical protein JW937_02365 [Candidatus Omnitrophica bacterium]|nr:hypothetical protein [Candidatus Omnitrophota bacterium]
MLEFPSAYKKYLTSSSVQALIANDILELLASMGVGISLLDRNLKIIWRNRVAEHLFRLPNSPDEESVQDADQLEESAAYSALRTGQVQKLDNCIREKKDGKTAVIMAMAAPLRDPHGHVTRILEVVIENAVTEEGMIPNSADGTRQRAAESMLPDPMLYLITPLLGADVIADLDNGD